MDQIPQRDAPELLFLYYVMQSEMRRDKWKSEPKQQPAMCPMQSQQMRDKNALSYEIYLQRSYLQYARKELTYEEIKEIENRYKELKNLYWKIFTKQ